MDSLLDRQYRSKPQALGCSSTYWGHEDACGSRSQWFYLVIGAWVEWTISVPPLKVMAEVSQAVSLVLLIIQNPQNWQKYAYRPV